METVDQGWMDGRWLRNLVAISDDPSVLDDGNFWAVVGTYEGQWRFARFDSVTTEPLSRIAHADGDWPRIGDWKSSLDRTAYCRGVERLREKIARGEIYQTNLCRILSAPCSAESLLPLAQKVSRDNPAPFLAWLELPEISIVCASPERFLERDGDLILSSPIKGTAKTAEEMLEKDQSENIMIVDLMRHDLGQVCQSGSVTTPRLLQIESHPGLVHLVSDVQGKLHPEVSWKEIFQATFPPGSITGAPKSTAMRAISELEPVPRGPYCGAIGWIQGDKARLAVAIRTFYLQGGILHFGTGAGITWESNPEQEWDETELKAQRLISIASAGS